MLQKKVDQPESIGWQTFNASFREDELNQRYRELPDNRIALHACYTTRPEGMLDILLSREIRCSSEIFDLLGKCDSHRDRMSSDFGSEQHFFQPGSLNTSISLSVGFWSFRYFDPDLRERESAKGGYAIFVPIEKVLEQSDLHFSHCSFAGGIKNYDLNRQNLIQAVHQARRDGDLVDDGFGNRFEVSIDAVAEERLGRSPKVIRFPFISILDGVKVALPIWEKDTIISRLETRQQRLLDIYKALDEPKTLEKRGIFTPDLTREFLNKILSPVDIEALPILWYSHRNVEFALKQVSIRPE